MPTYSATGITATLSIADLESSVTKSIDLRTGALTNESKRIGKVFAQESRLREQPIGRDGSKTGVVQFIGEDEDLPCFIVEACERSSTTDLTRQRAVSPHLSDHAELKSRLLNQESSMMTVESSLTSLGNTPSTGLRTFTAALSQSASPVHNNAPTGANGVEALPAHFTTQQPFTNPLQQLQEPRALMLEIETCKRSFPQKLNRKRGELPVPDMKIEVFMNGQLVNMHFVNYQRLGTDHKHKFMGTRIHRQIEKPWVYQAFEQAGDGDSTAEQRWSAGNDLLAEQMKLRDVNNNGNISLTAQYVHALSKLSFPDRLKGCSQLGILDVIITTGKGSKYGPSRGYLTSPQPMVSTQSDLKQEVPPEKEEDDPFVDITLPERPAGTAASFDTGKTSGLSSFNTTPLDGRATDASEYVSEVSGQILPSTSPAIPLARRTRSAAVDDKPVLSHYDAVETAVETHATNRKKTKIELLAEELGIPPDKMTMSRQWHSAKGKRSLCKTVAERLNDIRKMSLENQELAIAEVLEAISGKVTESPLSAGPARKKARRDSRLQSDDEAAFGMSVHSTKNEDSIDGPQIAQAMDLSMQDSSDDPGAVADQQRMERLMESGASPGGRLAERVSTLGSHRGSTKKALPPPSLFDMAPPPIFAIPVPAASSQSLTKKRPRQKSSNHETGTMLLALATLSSPHKQSKIANSPFKDEEHMLPQDQHHNTAIFDDTGKGGPRKKPGRRRKRLAPAEQSFAHEQDSEEALANFRPPKLCEGSVLTYAGPGMQRQINKSRPGIFDEEEFVVGMRFFVT